MLDYDKIPIYWEAIMVTIMYMSIVNIDPVLALLSLPLIISAAFSAIIIVGAFILPEVTCLITEESTTVRLCIPFTLKKS